MTDNNCVYVYSFSLSFGIKTVVIHAWNDTTIHFFPDEIKKKKIFYRDEIE